MHPSTVVTTAPVLAPEVPHRYERVAPRPFDTTRSILEQTASVVEGDVHDVYFSYEPCAGPRTHFRVRDARAIVGSDTPQEFEVQILGGPLPNGKWIHVSEVPMLAVGARYILFLRNTDWTFSPTIGRLALRKTQLSGREAG